MIVGPRRFSIVMSRVISRGSITIELLALGITEILGRLLFGIMELYLLQHFLVLLLLEQTLGVQKVETRKSNALLLGNILSSPLLLVLG